MKAVRDQLIRRWLFWEEVGVIYAESARVNVCTIVPRMRQHGGW